VPSSKSIAARTISERERPDAEHDAGTARARRGRRRRGGTLVERDDPRGSAAM
jgi:hypothetical protein